MRFKVKRHSRALLPARRGKSYQHRKARHKSILARRLGR